MALPFAVSAASTALGALGTLFADDNVANMPSEVEEILKLLQVSQKEGFSDQSVNLLQRGLNERLGSEFTALSGLAEERFARSGAGSAESAIARANRERMKSLGSSFGNIGIQDEMQKSRALGQLAGFAPQIAQFSQPSNLGFGSLFKFGVMGLQEHFRNKGQ